ncbi:MAG TPA: ABC transporter permease [Gemmatimonadales bacterium]|nr:ABC transporter permease [Gemmatimonadales bacterium]
MSEPGGYAAPLWGMVLRDLRVLRRNLGPFITRTVMNPLLFVFIFTYVLPRIGQGVETGALGVSYATILVPGLVAVGMVFQGISAVALPLSMELGATREIEDRVLAPLPVELVAVEKLCFGAAQGVLAGLVVFPLVYVIPVTTVSVRVASWPLLLLVIVLASLTSGALGLALGTIVRPQQIGLMFALVVVPITFLGCVYYPWALLHSIRWLQVLVLLNPLVYMSEGLRAALTPDLPHMPAPVFLSALALATLLLGGIGVRAFVRRTID